MPMSVMTSADEPDISKGSCVLESEVCPDTNNISEVLDLKPHQSAVGESNPLQNNLKCPDDSSEQKQSPEHKDHVKSFTDKLPRFSSCEISSCTNVEKGIHKRETKKRAHSVPSEIFFKDRSLCPDLLDSSKTTNHHTEQTDEPEQGSSPEVGASPSPPELELEKNETSSCKELCKATSSDGNGVSEQKPKKQKKNQGIKKSWSDRVKRQDVIQNFKGFFDSMSRKKQTKHVIQDKEHIYDVVEIKPECSIVAAASTADPQLPNTNENSSSTASLAVQGQTLSSPVLQSNLLKTDVCHENKLTDEGKVSTSSCVEDKLSHSVQRTEDNVGVEASFCAENKKVPLVQTKEAQLSTAVAPAVKVKPPVPKKPSNKSPVHQTTVEKKSGSVESPSSLYDTCCMRIACLLKDKAVHIVSKNPKSPPPPKPPKPSAETIAKARAAAVSRRLENVHKACQSIGESFPLGCASFRFVDDDTESSCDYKDVDSLDYLLDYELVSRPGLESKLDTFSVPSICSSITSYHTADEETVNESFSDCVSEMVSLRCDLSSRQENFARKETKAKKGPPPIPPKPAISKIKVIPSNDISSSINGFSSFTNLPKKGLKEQNEVLKRPLVVADIKKTLFSSLSHSKLKCSPTKSLPSLSEVKNVKSPPRPPPPAFSKPKSPESSEEIQIISSSKNILPSASDTADAINIKSSEKESENLSDGVSTEIHDYSVSSDLKLKNISGDSNADGTTCDDAMQKLISETPKPPPRGRRIRSRTVEVVIPEKETEKLKRSRSLSDADVEIRVACLETPKPSCDFKSLYSAVNKNEGKKPNGILSTPDLVSGRPLPAPPPPPRKFRSLERKCPESKTEAEIRDRALSCPIKPPSRTKSSEKKKGYSRADFVNKSRACSELNGQSSDLMSDMSCRDDHKKLTKESYHIDVNANFSSPDAEIMSNGSQGVISGKLTPEPKKERSRSSWYDEDGNSNENSEHSQPSGSVVHNTSDCPKPALRKKTESRQKKRETSTFYVEVEQKQETPPHADKETSPLPIHCSEKSVQTSLETLSHGAPSRNEEAEDSDELLNLAQSLQKELSTIIARHSSDECKMKSDSNLAADLEDSVPPSSSDVWPSTSSDESDGDKEGSVSNLKEAALSKAHRKTFLIAQEIMASEEMFVDAIRLLNVDFKAAVEAANHQQNFPVIPEEVLSQILNHLPQLLHLNENLLIEFKDRIQNWEKTEKIADIIVKMGPFLKLYSWYIHDFEPNVALFEESKRKYPAFAHVVKEFEASSRCKRLTLTHYMLKPIQRIPQYRLLLQEYLNHLSEDSKDYQDTLAALQIVSEVAYHANESLKQGDNAQKLISIQNSIIGHKEIVKPGRVFVKEGELMKLSRKGMQPRWFILFNDLLLYLTPVQPGLYRINHDLPLTGMKVAIPIQQDYQNEFSIISVKRSFTLAARSSDERQEWIVALTKAIEENALKRSTFMLPCLQQKAQDKLSSEDEASFVLGRKAPVWIPDARVTMCQLCTCEFTVTFRRHHCRACGKVICSICSSHRISLPYLGHRVARVCDDCHAHLGQKSSACSESGETDSENQQTAAKPHLRTDVRPIKKNRRFLPSVLKEVCANDQGSTISGYLYKKLGKGWKRDWFVLKDKVLYEYKASEDVAALRSTPLLGYQVSSFNEPYENIDSSLLFQLSHPGQSPMIFYSETACSTERWMSALKTATYLE